ncbi:hypothetical protein BKA67DRAFT_536374 [Truncatella angustata]|uniref:Uncharacterized protein n=1 Tax=Truncatella angustata TaxID=152316 RepID=A0A9P8UHV1_9PEZI|nr:uncharacterized protein BKA67DRAFT_536374 [Truncatella angustata]KAH6652643.1 hypothetical protein BKA67DRAFT_536374 [Truncatella angustata]
MAPEFQDCASEAMSVHAGAESLDLEHGGTRLVQVIHESVRDFFLHYNGFMMLDPEGGLSASHTVADGHLSIITTCLDYINIRDMDALVEIRTRVNMRTSQDVLVVQSFSGSDLFDFEPGLDMLKRGLKRSTSVSSFDSASSPNRCEFWLQISKKIKKYQSPNKFNTLPSHEKQSLEKPRLEESQGSGRTSKPHANVNARNFEGWPVLHQAPQNHDSIAMEFLL